MINSLQLWPFYRETWGYFDPPAIAQLAPAAVDDCYQPKYYKLPDDDQDLLEAGAYLKYGLSITPGSLIWGIYHKAPNGQTAAGFVFKITDLDLGIEVFDSPTPDMFVSNDQPSNYPWLLNAPYPVVGTGVFNVELWNVSGAQLRCNLVIGVLEVQKCKY